MSTPHAANVLASSWICPSVPGPPPQVWLPRSEREGGGGGGEGGYKVAGGYYNYRIKDTLESAILFFIQGCPTSEG